MMVDRILITGATGLLGGLLLRSLSVKYPEADILVMVREPKRWIEYLSGFGLMDRRVAPVAGDLLVPGVGLTPEARAALGGRFSSIIHLAADTCLTSDLEQARAVNVEGTRQLLEATEVGGSPFCLVSTALVAGLRTGRIMESDLPSRAGWANAHEQSKAEAEEVVRSSGRDFTIMRSSPIVCDTSAGRVTRYSPLFQLLRFIHAGFTPVLPGRADSPVDVVPADFVADAIRDLAFRRETRGATFHLCAGEGAATLENIIEWSWEVWSEDPLWRRRSITSPVLTDFYTYQLFETAALETGDAPLVRLFSQMGGLVPHFAHAKHFDTSGADAALGYRAPSVSSYWRAIAAEVNRSVGTGALESAA
ncbi:MAG: SDR family oxidoreductase [Gemmatimonadota bacterium]|jgi:long-chain acyl-CoA synthetase|nr:SDR family oxidoreductase [Gemmatimonadota bacterium]